MIGAGLEDLGKGERSMTGTIYSTEEKGVRYLELTEGYITKMALDKDNQVIGYEYVKLGVMLDKIKAGLSADEAYKAATGHYGRFTEAEGVVKFIDPRKE